MCRLASDPVQAWAPAVQALIGNYNIPGARAAERILRWISIESCGNQCSIDASRSAEIAAGWVPDAGVMQIYFSSPNQVINGATSGSLRASCIGVTQIWPTLTDDQRVAYLVPQLGWLQGAIASAQAKLNAVGADWQERDQWRWYKLVTHGIPALGKCALWMATQALGRAPSGWDELKSTFQNLTMDNVRTAAADPADNGCTASVYQRHSDGTPFSDSELQSWWNTGWNNAEEMDLPDEASLMTNLNEIIMDAISPGDQPGISGYYGIILGVLGIAAGAAAGYYVSKRYLHSA